MADIHDRWLYADNQKDILKEYLIDDIIRLSLLIDAVLDIKEMKMSLLLLSAEELTETHRKVSNSFEKQFGIEHQMKN